MSGSLLISQLSARTGFSASALRYYEQVGLLAAAERSPAGYRLYDESAVSRLRFIDRAKQLGLPLEEIRDLALVWQDGRCAHVQDRLRDLVAAKSVEVAARIEQLRLFSTQLDQATADLTAPASPGPCGDGCGCADAGGDVVAVAQLVELIPNRRVRPSPEPVPAPASVPVACTLQADEQSSRVTEWRELLRLTTGRESIDGGLRLYFALDPELVARVGELAAREESCCAFFIFTLRLVGGAATLDIVAPADALDLLSDLFDDAR